MQIERFALMLTSTTPSFIHNLYFCTLSYFTCLFLCGGTASRILFSKKCLSQVFVRGFRTLLSGTWVFSIIVPRWVCQQVNSLMMCPLWQIYVTDGEPLSNRPISQIPQCTCTLSHNALFCNRNVHICSNFCYKIVHYGIFQWCIVGHLITGRRI